MPDRIPVSAADLAAALEGRKVTIGDHANATSGTLTFPAQLAELVFAALNEGDPLPDGVGEADPELAAIGTAVAHLEPLDGEAQRRVLRYLADRYGIED